MDPGPWYLLGAEDLAHLTQIWCTLYPAHAESAITPVELADLAFAVFQELRLKLLNGKNVSSLTIDIRTELPKEGFHGSWGYVHRNRQSVQSLMAEIKYAITLLRVLILWIRCRVVRWRIERLTGENARLRSRLRMLRGGLD